jgi:hypothetical protein
MVMVLAPDKRAKQSAAARSARAGDGDTAQAPAPPAEHAKGTSAETTTAPEAMAAEPEASVPAEGEG